MPAWFFENLFLKSTTARQYPAIRIYAAFFVVRETLVQKSNNGIPEKVNYQSFL